MTPIGSFGRHQQPSSGYIETFAERLFSRHEPADLARNLKHEVEEFGDRPRSNTLNGQDDDGGVGESFREDERHMAEKDLNPYS